MKKIFMVVVMPWLVSLLLGLALCLATNVPSSIKEMIQQDWWQPVLAGGICAILWVAFYYRNRIIYLEYPAPFWFEALAVFSINTSMWYFGWLLGGYVKFALFG